jgi:hypothetical protein
MMHRDLFEDEGNNSFGTMLMKGEIINFFNYFYEARLLEFNEKDITDTKNFCFAFLTRLLAYEYSTEPEKVYLQIEATTIYAFYN